MEFGEVARIVREGCNGIKQFEKQVSKVTVKKYAGKNRAGEREKTSRNVRWGGGGGATSDEKVLYRMKKLKFTRGILGKIQ